MTSDLNSARLSRRRRPYRCIEAERSSSVLAILVTGIPPTISISSPREDSAACGESGVAHRICASEDRSQASHRQAVFDCAPRDAQRQQLTAGHDALLAGRQARDRLIVTSAVRTNAGPATQEGG